MRIATLPLYTNAARLAPFSRELVGALSAALEKAPGVVTARAVYTTEENDVVEFALPISEEMAPLDTVLDIGRTMECDFAIDGQLRLDDENASFLLRITDLAAGSELARRSYRCARRELLGVAKAMVVDSLVVLGVPVDDDLYDHLGDFGTDDPEAFISFLMGRDGIMYMQTAGAKLSVDFEIDALFHHFFDALRRDPDFRDARENLCAIAVEAVYERHIAADEAVTMLQQVVQISGADWRPHAALAQIYTRLQNWRAAEVEWRSALRHNPRSSALHTDLGASLVSQGRYSEAVDSLETALELNPSEVQALEHMGICLVQLDREDEAIPYWEAAILLRPDNSITYTNLGRAYIMVGDVENAERVFELGLANADDPATIYRNYAPYLAETGRVDEALEMFDQAAAYYPFDVMFLIEYANTLGKLGRTDRVRGLLEQILSLSPSPDDRAQAEAWLLEIDHPELFEEFKQASDEVWDGNTADGVRALEDLSGRAGTYWKVWHMLSRGYNKMRKYKLAEAAARRVLDLFPNYEWAYGELTGALFKQRRYKDAYSELRKAWTRLPSSVPVLCNLAMAAYYLRKRGEALDYLRKAKSLCPEDQEADRLLSLILDES